jgi:hypothetical protein
MNYCHPLWLFSHWHSAKTCCCACHACLIDNDWESWAMCLHDILPETFGNEAMGCTQFKEWFKWFKERRLLVQSDEHSGRPSMGRNQLMIDKVCSAVLDNHRTAMRQLSDQVGAFIWIGAIHCDRRFGHETHLSKICFNTAYSWVPPFLKRRG